MQKSKYLLTIVILLCALVGGGACRRYMRDGRPAWPAASIAAEAGVPEPDVGEASRISTEEVYTAPETPAQTGRARERLLQCCQAAYAAARDHFTPGTLEFARQMLREIGAAGYTAVDMENQMDMANREALLHLIDRADEGKTAAAEIVCVAENGDLRLYHFDAADGKIQVLQEYYLCDSGRFTAAAKEMYEASAWDFTEEGWLFFDAYHMDGYDGPPGHTAIRVLPLEETCRALNRKYILPVGYALNNLFLQDWDEKNFAALDFYDLFDRLYPLCFDRELPYAADEDCSVGAVYDIPAAEFEGVIQTCFNIEGQTLRSLAKYDPAGQCYEYRPRGLFDAEPPDGPFPEVISYEERDDGTLALTVRAVFPDRHSAGAYQHEVIVRPLAQGKYQYVSNHVSVCKAEEGKAWHVDRLTDEEWEAAYGKKTLREGR